MLCALALGLAQLSHKLMEEEQEHQESQAEKQQACPALPEQANQLAGPRRRSGRTPALPYPPPETAQLYRTKNRRKQRTPLTRERVSGIGWVEVAQVLVGLRKPNQS